MSEGKNCGSTVPRNDNGFPEGIVQSAFGRVTVSSSVGSLAPHAHAEYNVLIKLNGPDTFFSSEGENLRLSERGVLLFNPWQPHCKLPCDAGPTQLLVLLIEADWLYRMTGRLAAKDQLFSTVLAETTPAIRALAERLAAAVVSMHPQENENYNEFVASLMREIVGVHADDGLGPRHSATDARIRRAVQLLKEHAHENPNLEDIACRVGMSRSRFFEQFKSCLGVSPQQYLDWARLGLATNALIYSNKSVSDIAGELGFSQQTHFTRFFRQYKGVPPREFRRRAYAAEHPYEATIAVKKLGLGKTVALGLG